MIVTGTTWPAASAPVKDGRDAVAATVILPAQSS
jgi:hypothetical protein